MNGLVIEGNCLSSCSTKINNVLIGGFILKRNNLIILLILLTFMAGCSLKEDPESVEVNNQLKEVGTESKVTHKEERKILVGSDYPMSFNFEEAIAKSDLIVSGYYGDLESKWNMARSIDNPNLEHEKDYTEGLIYNFLIEEVMFSSTSFSKTSIPVNLRHFKRIDIPFEDGTLESIDYVDPFFIEPNNNQKYILLLTYSPRTGNYYAPTEPFQFILNEDNNEITAKSNIFDEEKSNITKYGNVTVRSIGVRNVTDHFSGTRLEELEQLIHAVKRR